MEYPQMIQIALEENSWPDVSYIVIKPEKNTHRSCLEALLGLTEELSVLFENHPEIDEEEPWFGWAFELDGALQSELTFFQQAVKNPELHGLVDSYIRHVITYFEQTDAEPGFYVHEEKEAASDAILSLVSADPTTYFGRYLEYLNVVDLEHTVAQSDNVRLLKEVLSEAQLTQLRAALQNISGGEYLPTV